MTQIEVCPQAREPLVTTFWWPRTLAQFVYLAKLVCAEWLAAGVCSNYVETFRRAKMSAPMNLWFVGAICYIHGKPPCSQPIESYNWHFGSKRMFPLGQTIDQLWNKDKGHAGPTNRSLKALTDSIVAQGLLGWCASRVRFTSTFKCTTVQQCVLNVA